MARAAHKPNSVPDLARPDQVTIIHLRATIARCLLRPTREFERAALKHSPIWSCTGWGLQSFSGHPKNWCALTAPFHPYLKKAGQQAGKSASGGILSVALSFTLPRLHVMEHPALWCSDFPQVPVSRNPRSSRLLWPTMLIISSNGLSCNHCLANSP